MTLTPGKGTRWPRTVFDTKEWQNAWSHATIEKTVQHDNADPPMYAVEWSPFWGGYEADAGMAPLWDRPLLTVGTLYAFYGPAYVLDDPGTTVATVTDRAAARAEEWNTAGVLVANLPEEAAVEWAAIRPPDAYARLDIAYWRIAGVGRDPVVGDAGKRVRTDWRRRWRRATEQGVRLVEETDPDPARIDEVIGLANASAQRHDWPAVYNLATAKAALAIPGTRLIRADWSGRTVAGFLALEHARTLYLWAGGMDPELSEVSPYLFALYELLATAEERGRDRIEFGRGNDSFKRKYSFEGTHTWSLWYARTPEEAPAYRERLQTLHERLSHIFGVAPRPLGERAPDPFDAKE